jgi:signal transduction histidine kinase/ligand-binding sensor domain-containing protein
MIAMLAADPASSGSLARFEHRSWSVREGAPPDVWALAQDSDGFLWLGTGAGLYRFDGVRFDRFEPAAGEHLPSNNITALTLTPHGDIWLGYYFGGLSLLRDGHLTHYGEPQGVPAGAVFRIAASTDALWAATSGGLARFDGERWEKMTAAQGFPSDFAGWVHVDETGSVWAAGDEALLVLHKGAQRFETASERIGRRSVIAQSADGALWLSDAIVGTRTVRGAGRVVSKDGQPVYSKRLLVDREGLLWGTDDIRGGVYRTAPGTGLDRVAERFGLREGLSADIAVPILEDAEGNVWVGTNLGIDQFRRTSIIKEARAGSTSPAGFTLAAEANGAVLIANSEALMRLRGGELKTLLPLHTEVSCAYYDEDGTVWIGQRDALLHIRGDQIQRMPLPGSLADRGLQAIGRYAGTLWISVEGAGVFRLEGGRWIDWSDRLHTAGIAANVITVGSDRLWLGYSENRVITLAQGQMHRYSSSDGLDVGHVMAVRVSTGGAWIGGERGLARIDGDHARTLNMRRVDALQGITGIVVTADDVLWLNGGMGVVRISASEIERAFADPEYEPVYRLFDHLDGLPGVAQQATPIPTAIAASDGRLWFATNHGVVWIDPAQIVTNEVPPRVVIRSIAADGVHHEPDASLELPARTASLRFDYTGLSFSVPERVQFRYRLEGFDTDWQEAGSRREAFYTNLDPGDYTFRVLAANNDGVWNETGASASFSIPPAFVQSGTFLALCCAALAGALWLLYQLRLRQVLQQMNGRLQERLMERERIARELHDTFLQSVQGLILRFQSATSQIPADQPARQLMEQALDRADRVLVEGRDHVRDLRADEEKPDLPQALAIVGEELRQDEAAELCFLLNGAARPLHPVVRDEALRIATEALANAFHHAQAARIEIDLDYSDRSLTLHIRDNGRGIAQPVAASGRREGHWGLVGMRERAHRIGGRLEIWSGEHKGTEIKLEIPARIAYAADEPRRIRWLPPLRRIFLQTQDGQP